MHFIIDVLYVFINNGIIFLIQLLLEKESEGLCW